MPLCTDCHAEMGKGFESSHDHYHALWKRLRTMPDDPPFTLNTSEPSLMYVTLADIEKIVRRVVQEELITHGQVLLRVLETLEAQQEKTV